MEFPKAPSPWLAPGISAIALLAFCVWAYVQMDHWKSPQADSVAIAVSIFGTGLLVVLLLVAIYVNFRDSSRAKALRSQILALNFEHREEIKALKRKPTESKVAMPLTTTALTGLRFHSNLTEVGRRIESAFYGSNRKKPDDVSTKVNSFAEAGEVDIPVNHYALCEDSHDPDEDAR